jgi:type IV secretory pathway VirB3-like protein
MLIVIISQYIYMFITILMWCISLAIFYAEKRVKFRTFEVILNIKKTTGN